MSRIVLHLHVLNSLTHSLTYSLTHLLTHSLTYSLTHSLTHASTPDHNASSSACTCAAHWSRRPPWPSSAPSRLVSLFLLDHSIHDCIKILSLFFLLTRSILAGNDDRLSEIVCINRAPMDPSAAIEIDSFVKIDSLIWTEDDSFLHSSEFRKIFWLPHHIISLICC